ncbi:SDR family NAD(P)-dependent oxidoreductase [Conexibacter sp. SYSU D00693]|uniref:SDR family NAD(P)-dependent oxidoreductase n=1 Tax=Conexibacter sp. SYSU D00693 TaxID=2812560 RepID=UPI00196B9E78|nr:SDR family NAD(P)-dependent oxidoreductase [Conexibacter sp. SYSU D00693]
MQTKTWFITGASRGLGRLWTEAALERGDQVAATARDAAALQPLAERFGGRVLPLTLDVTDRDAAFAAVQQAVARFGRLDVVLNNAGFGHIGMVEELQPEEVRAQLETNLLGTLWVTQAALPTMREQGHGHLVQVTSEGGVRAFPEFGAYHASKWAVEGLSASLAQEVAAFGIKVTCLEPGPYATGFAESAHLSPRMAQYDGVREALAFEWDLGDPTNTADALLQVVDSEDPPRQVLLGRSFEAIERQHQERLDTWRAWQPVALAAA